MARIKLFCMLGRQVEEGEIIGLYFEAKKFIIRRKDGILYFRSIEHCNNRNGVRHYKK
jgi:hypothetical protein